MGRPRRLGPCRVGVVIRRGEVWWADLPGPIGRRPVLVLTRDPVIAVRANVTVAPITTRARDIPTEVRLGPEDGLPKPCVVDLDSLQTMSKATLRDRIAPLSRQKMNEVEAAIRFALSLG